MPHNAQLTDSEGSVLHPETNEAVVKSKSASGQIVPLKDALGALANLNTADKTSLVAAINDIVETLDNMVISGGGVVLENRLED